MNKSHNNEQPISIQPSNMNCQQTQFSNSLTVDQLNRSNLSTEESVKNFPDWSDYQGMQNISSSMTNSKTEFPNRANEYRKVFYHFLGQIKDNEEVVKRYNLLFHTDLNLIPIQICSPTQLSESFENELLKLSKNPRQRRKNWSAEESHLLISFVAYFCSVFSEEHNKLNENAWQFLSTIYPGKNQEQLKLKWQSLLKVPLNKIPWSNREDVLLLSIVKERGPDNWREIALELHSKSGNNLFRQSKQCRERWINHLDPNLKKGSWTDEEDLLLLKELSQRGKKWSEIAKTLPGRTENSVKNRWISLLRKYKLEGNHELARASEQSDGEDTVNSEIIKSLIESKEKLATSGESKGAEHKKKNSKSQKKQKSESLDSNLEGNEYDDKSKIRKDPDSNRGSNKNDLEYKLPIFSSEKQFLPQGIASNILQQKGNFLKNGSFPASHSQSISNDDFKPTEQTPPSNNSIVNQQLKESLQQIVNGPISQTVNSNSVTQPMGPIGSNTYQIPTNYSPYNPYQMPQQIQHAPQHNPYGVYPPGFTPWDTNFSPYYQANALPNWNMQAQYPYLNANSAYTTNHSQFYPQSLPYQTPPNFNQQPSLMPMAHSNPGITFPGAPNYRLEAPNNLLNKPLDPNLDIAMTTNSIMNQVFPINPLNQNLYNKFPEPLKLGEQPIDQLSLVPNNNQQFKEEGAVFSKKFLPEGTNVDRFLKNFK